MKNFKIIAVITFLACSINTFAQKVKYPIKPKLPKLTVMLGEYKDTSSISNQAVASVISLPLKVINDKNESYQITSYQFLYRKNVVSENEETGKTYNTQSVKSSLFKITPLPTLWINAISENPKVGEEIIFFDVIVKDKNGLYMYAPNLKLTVK